MALMSQGQMIWAFISIFLCFVSLGLICTSIGTDQWFQTSLNTTNHTIVTETGLWKTCESKINKDGWTLKTCTNRELIDRDTNTADQLLQLRLELSFVISICLSAFIQFLTHLILLCGLLQCCTSLKKTHLFFIVSITQLFAVLIGIVGCICFMALQDELKRTQQDELKRAAMTYSYQWSFMLAWISIGLCLIESGIFVVLVKVCFDNVFQSGKFNYYSM